MQINRDYESGISLKRALFYVLYRWRSILVVAIVLAIVLGAYQFISEKQIHDAGKLTKIERQYQLNVQSYQEDLEGAKITIADLTKTLKGQRDYQANSVYINLDAQNVWVATNKYLIKVDQSVIDSLPAGSSMDPADSILPAYAEPLSGEMDMQALGEAFGTERTEYISELLSVERNAGDNSVTVRVKGGTREDTEKGMAFIHQQMLKISNGKAQEINAHQLVLLSENVTLGTDAELAQLQVGLRKSIDDNQKELQAARQTLDELEEKGEPRLRDHQLIKMIVVGFFAGLVMLAFAYLISFFMRGYLTESRDITEQYALPVLGELNGSVAKTNKGLDKLFQKWELKNKNTDDQKIYDQIAVLIDEQKDVKSILLTSTLPEERIEQVKEELASRVNDKEFFVRADYNLNSEAVKEANHAEMVILVETKGVSRNQPVKRMVETLIIGQANVYGTILL